MEKKLKECFDDFVVYKDLKNNSFFSSLRLPSFLRDWVLRKFEDETGSCDAGEIAEFVKTYMPKREDWVGIKNRIVYEYERVKILTRLTININIRTGEIAFALPDFDITAADTIIEPDVWDRHKDELTSMQEVWGVAELGYRAPDPNARPKQDGKIKLTSFSGFCPYTPDTDYYRDARREFTTDEWINAVLGAVDYNGNGYASLTQKMASLSRLLPFVEKNLNLIELAPKGTGKSYFFGNINKYGMLTDGGKLTRAKMFYDMSSRTPGFICGHDFVAIDEVREVSCNDMSEMRSVMQGYMAAGKCNVGGNNIESTAGIMLLGNILKENMDEYKSMFPELSDLFKNSALIDRIHGFIKGWDIPEIQDSIKVSGWALNTEFFCSVAHELRDDARYRALVDRIVNVSDNAYERHTEAVKRLATAFLKLLFPHAIDIGELKPEELREIEKYCLRPAVKMRTIIWRQLSILDDEYKDPRKMMPKFEVEGL